VEAVPNSTISNFMTNLHVGYIVHASSADDAVENVPQSEHVRQALFRRSNLLGDWSFVSHVSCCSSRLSQQADFEGEFGKINNKVEEAQAHTLRAD
jgi:hypothetical protein